MSATAPAYCGPSSGSSIVTPIRSFSPVGTTAPPVTWVGSYGMSNAVATSRETHHAQAIGSIGCHFEIDDVVLDGCDLESAQSYLVGDLFGRGFDVNEVAQPGKDEAHQYGNCSRNLRSFS